MFDDFGSLSEESNQSCPTVCRAVASTGGSTMKTVNERVGVYENGAHCVGFNKTGYNTSSNVPQPPSPIVFTIEPPMVARMVEERD